MKYYTNYLIKFKENYMMMIPLTIIFQSCLGSIAVMYMSMHTGGQTLFLELFLCICVSMTYNAAILAQLKPKIIFMLLQISLLVNTFLIVINLI